MYAAAAAAATSLRARAAYSSMRISSSSSSSSAASSSAVSSVAFVRTRQARCGGGAWRAPGARLTRRLARPWSSSSSSRVSRGHLHRASAGKAVDADGAPHVSVMLEEILECFADVETRTHVDGTLGAGGHAAAMITRHAEMEQFIGFDVDRSAHALAQPRLEQAREKAAAANARATGTLKLSLVEANFRQMREALKALKVDGVDSILLDLGVSSMHLDRAERGFSFMNDGPLDMRMGESAKTTAEEIVNTWPEEEIGRILRDYGEERHWRLLAKRICEARVEKDIKTTRELVEAIGNVPGKWGSIHPATRTFQGIRIAVNDELGAVEDVIPAAIEALRPGGRLAIISFHSLEDSIVKKQFRKFAGFAEPLSEEVNRYMPQPEKPPKIVRLITRKPLVPSAKEIDENVRSRSAKLRVCEKL
jgi:16S rRNA (cytosine1402-N4)-methyltransferase